MAVQVRQMVEINPPEQLKFDTPGQQLSGYLLRFQTIQVKGKDTHEFTIEIEGTKKLATFLGTWDLEKRIGQLVREHGWGVFVVITYTGEDGAVETQGNKLKRFKLACDPNDRHKGALRQKPDPAEAELRITDEDIPF